MMSVSTVNFRDRSVPYNCLMTRLLLFQESTMNSHNFSRLPYEACLIPNLSEEIQHQVRDISNYVVRPLYMLFAVMAFVCNALICVTVTRTKSLQRPSLLTLCSLSVTDLIYALFSLYMFSLYMLCFLCTCIIVFVSLSSCLVFLVYILRNLQRLE